MTTQEEIKHTKQLIAQYTKRLEQLKLQLEKENMIVAGQMELGDFIK